MKKVKVIYNGFELLSLLPRIYCKDLKRQTTMCIEVDDRMAELLDSDGYLDDMEYVFDVVESAVSAHAFLNHIHFESIESLEVLE